MIKKLYFTLICLIGLHVASFAQWTIQTSGTSSNLKSVYFTNADTGYAVGDCAIIKTTDGGINWVSQTNGTSYTCQNSIFFINSNYGYVVGQWIILKTIDGGNNWIPTIDSTGTDELLSVFFPDDSIGYSVGHVDSGKIYKTTDRGTTWFKLPCTLYDFLILNSIYFTSKDTGYVVGDEGIIFKTINGGVNWTQQTSGTSNQLFSVYFVTKDIGYAVGDNATILKTNNGGTTWMQLTTNLSYVYYSVYFTNIDTGYVVGGNPFVGGMTGVILKTTDGGTNWTSQTIPVNPIFSSVYFPTSDTGYAVGCNGTILKTTNGGVVGIEEKNEEELIKTYPNPASNVINIRLDWAGEENVRVELFDFIGKKVAEERVIPSSKGLQMLKLDVSQINKGIYLLQVQTNKFVKTVRVEIM